MKRVVRWWSQHRLISWVVLIALAGSLLTCGVLLNWRFPHLHPDAWTAIAAWVTLLLLGLSAGVAYFQLHDARGLREEEARPVVVVDLDVDKHPHLIYLYFQNLGKTTAHNVRLNFTPPLRTTLGDDRVAGFFGHSFPTLPPGKRIESYLDSAIERLADGVDLDTSYQATVNYQDRNGHEYQDSYVLDIEVFRGRVYASKKGMEDIANTLEDISKLLGQWNTPFGGIRTITQSEEDAAQQSQDRMAALKHAHDQLSERLTNRDLDPPAD